MKKIITMPALSCLTLSIWASLGHATELNTDFLQGVSGVPSVLKDNVAYPAGHYYVDVSLNGQHTSRMVLSISVAEEQAGMLCLSPQWLQEAGVLFKPTAYQDTFDKDRECYTLASKESTGVNFSLGAQTVDFAIPQAWLVEKNDATRWDYGVNGLRLTYNGNFNQNVQTRNSYQDDSLNAYGHFNTALNMGRWVLSSDMNATRNTSGNTFDTNNITLSTAISRVKGDFILGRSQTRTELFSDFGFWGASLRSNSNMRAWSTRGYAPVINGVAPTTARITVTQNNYTVYSTVVPPGPYRLDDITPVGNGSLMVTVEDSAGRKTTTEYPVATLPTLLRPGDLEYNLAAGQRSDTNTVDDAFRSGTGTFVLGSLDYGLATTTVNTAFILHDRFQSAGLGLSQPLGVWGAFSASINASKAEYDHGENRRGMSASFKYAKTLGERTELQLLTYRYQSPGYTEFANWRPDERLLRPGGQLDAAGNYTFLSGKEKARYEARLSHRWDQVYMSGSFWQQSFWDRDRDALGATVTASATVFDGVSVNLSGNYARSTWSTRDDWSTTLGVSIPFTLGGVRHYASNSVSYNRDGDTAFNTSATATVSDRFNYGVNAGADSRNNRSAGLNAGYAFDRVQTNMALAQGRDTTTLSGSLSGSAIATRETGLLFTREASDTVAVVKIKDMPGVTFNNSLPTNSKGNTVMYLSSYSPSSISINPENVPDSAELLNTSYEVVPTEKAIIYREFGFENVLRYILRLRDAQGTALNGGSATTEQGLDAGFITGNGVLLMNVLAAPKTVTVRKSNGEQCRFDGAQLKPNTGTVQEIRCE